MVRSKHALWMGGSIALAIAWCAACSSSGGGASNPSAGASGSAGAGGAGGASSSGSTTSTGGSAGAAGSAGVAGSAGAAGSSDAGPGGGGASGGTACSGSFGPAELQFMDAGQNSDNLSLTADELELFYVHSDPTMSAPPRVVVRRRTAKSMPFSDPVDVPEVSSLCTGTQNMFIDVSEDGLRLYFSCANIVVDMTTAPLRRASRSNRMSPFALDTAPIGMVARSFSLSADELTAFASPLALDDPGEDFVYKRAGVTDSFGPGERLAGIPASFRNPEPTRDGLQLFGAMTDTPSMNSLAVATRASVTDPFSPPDKTGLPTRPDGVFVVGSPAITADCRTLFFVGVRMNGTVLEWAVFAARR